MGRPKKEHHRKPIHVRLSDEERKIIDKAVECEGGTVAGLLRREGLAGAWKVLIKAEEQKKAASIQGQWGPL
jgi:uncharacterized protein (DUF1778 family)